ncbi:hypothetical protein HPB52_015914 [Rhipicephalus sanguineus]|uniref:Uncharacterized protein n=1 Tax=Rhipicephalus sanguineus TaxID=34632 RepID=A0A9D4Q7A9_RHISA|nr:hypothetical protein HPB52_015914 [Rhipicephalus sanguineus]
MRRYKAIEAPDKGVQTVLDARERRVCSGGRWRCAPEVRAHASTAAPSLAARGRTSDGVDVKRDIAGYQLRPRARRPPRRRGSRRRGFAPDPGSPRRRRRKKRRGGANFPVAAAAASR